MLAILIWIILGLFNFVYITYTSVKRYNEFYSDMGELFIGLVISIILSPIVLTAILVDEIKYQFEKHNKG
jgi:hypothetical protein